MEDFGTDRTLSGREWRVLLLTAGGVLVVGVGLGVLIGRIVAVSADPPPVSASILPDPSPSPDTSAVVPSPPDDEDTDAPPPMVPPPVVLRAAAPPAPVAQRAPPAEPAATPPRVDAKRRAKRPAPARRATAAPAPPPAGGRRWVVQLGAFQSSDHANLLVNTLAAHGQAAHAAYARNAAGQGWFYVQTPPFRSAAAARNAAKSLAAREHLPTYLVKLPEPGS